jgi:hypothetical protein
MAAFETGVKVERVDAEAQKLDVGSVEIRAVTETR